MKVFFILLFSLLTPALSFTSPRPVFVARTHSVALEDTAAEEYLAGCLDKWDEVEKELVNLKAEAKVSSDDIVSYNMSLVLYLLRGFLTFMLTFSHDNRPTRLQLPPWRKKC